MRAELAAPLAPPLGLRTCTRCRRSPRERECWAQGSRTRCRRKCCLQRPTGFAPLCVTVAKRPSVAGAEERGLGRVPSPPPVHQVAPSHGSGGAQGSWTRQLEIACLSVRLVVRAPRQPSFRLPSETPVPIGESQLRMSVGSAFPLLAVWDAPPPASVITSLPSSARSICSSPCLPGQRGTGDE